MADEHAQIQLELSPSLDLAPQIRRLAGHEAISQLFSFDLEVAIPGRRGPEHAGEVGSLLGSNASLVWYREGEEIRRLHGILCEVSTNLGSEADHRSLSMRFVPRAWTLGLVEKIDIFMDVSVPEIIEKTLGLHALASGDGLEMRLRSSYPTREFVVQYGETDLALVSRLAEHLGIAFFISHRDGRDDIVWVDATNGFDRVEASIPWRGRGDRRDLFELDVKQEMIPAFYAVRDYNYRTPTVDLQAGIESEHGAGGGIVEYGSHFKNPDEGRDLAQVRAQEREAQSLVYGGRSDDPAIGAGRLLTVADHPSLPDSDLLVTEVHHRCTQPTLASGAGMGEERYENTFKAIPAARTYRPPRRTPVPRVHGLLTGVIEGPEGTTGDFASIDAEGRYTVRFLYDTAAPGERRASRPVRMAQPHSGAGYGTHFPLKPGTEVVLAFVNGDPDRPIIVGAVPNPQTPTPVRDANLTSNMIKTASGIFFDFNDGPRGR